MGAPLYGRVLKLLVGSSDIGQFDIEATVEKTPEKNPNTARIVVYNLPEDLRTKFQNSAGEEVTVEAGYKVDGSGVVFKGDLRFASSAIRGPDWVTSIEAGEKEKAYRAARVSKSFNKGATIKDVVKHIVSTFDGVGEGNVGKVLGQIADQFPNGVTFDGPSQKILDDVLKAVNLTYSVQNGSIQLLEEGGSLEDQPRIGLSYPKGLLGVPEMGEQKGADAKKKPFAKIKCLCQHRMIPGRIIELDSPLLRGNFVAQKVTHTLDNYAGSFYTDTEAYRK